MRVAILTEVFSREYGVARVIAAQIAWLLRAGICVDVFACEIERPIISSGIRLVRVPTHVKGLRACLDAGRYDAIIAHTHPFFRVISELKGCYRILYEHGMPPADHFPVEEQQARLATIADMITEVYPKVDQVITISNFGAKYIGWPQARVIYNGADHYDYGQPHGANVLSTTDQIKILCVSRFGHGEQQYKGIDTLVQLSKDLGPAFQVILAGRGSEADVDRLRACGITLIPYPTEEELSRCYLASDVVVSFSKWELFNLPLAEAGFASKPAYALDIGPHPEVTPFVFSNYEELRDRLAKADHEMLRREGLVMFEHVAKNFRWERNAKQLVELLQSNVKQSPHLNPKFRWHAQLIFWAMREKLRRMVKRFLGHG